MDPIPLQPTAPEERVSLLDVLRGFALFGILLVNIRSYSAPLHAPALIPGWAAMAEGWVRAISLFLLDGKFIGIFTLLFGMGMALQVARAEARGDLTFRAYRRRLWGLLLLGLLHVGLLWPGDVLVPYALMGFLLLRFRRVSDRALLIWAACLTVLPAGVALLLPGGEGAVGPVPGYSPWAGGDLVWLERYSHGSFGEITRLRLYDWLTSVAGGILGTGWLQILGAFLLGLYAGRTGLFTGEPERLARLRRLALLPGLAGAGLYQWAAATGSAFLVAGWILGGLGLGAVYAATLALLHRQPQWQERLSWLAAPGRMALTNYLAQSLICTMIFYGYGFGLFGHIGPMAQTLIATGVFAVQAVYSRLWLRRFAYGPIEWALRFFAYRTRPVVH